MPVNLFFFDSFVKDILDPACSEPRKLIKDYKEMLDSFSVGGEAEDTKEEVLNEFFEF